MSEAPDPRVKAARLRWQGDRPVSGEFGDIYHAHDGIAEVNRVFLDPVEFPRRCAEAANSPLAPLVVGEIGFGSALNFVTFAERFLTTARPLAQLHFVSFEASPIESASFARLADRRARAQPLYAELARLYPPLLAGWHRVELAGGRIRLSLFFGDGEAGLVDLDSRQPTPIAAWLLDGFDPRKNPRAWSNELIAAIARLSGPGTSIATFSAAGTVRRALVAHGFDVARIDQRPHKRHSLAGVFRGAPALSAPRRRPSRVVVVGAGLAGVCTSHTLAAAGIETLLVEREPERAMALPGTVLHTRLLADDLPASRMRRSAYFRAAAFYRDLGFAATGALQFTGTNLDRNRMERIGATFASSGAWLELVDATTASNIAGTRLRDAALYFPGSRIVDGRAVAERVRAHGQVRYAAGTLRGIAPIAGGIRLQFDTDAIEADAVVLCTGCPPELPQAAALEVLPVAGQLELASLPARIRVPLFADGYICPLGTAGYAFGATYEQRPWDVARATAFNLERAGRDWQRLTGTGFSPRLEGVARGSRAISSDRLPVIGQLTTSDAPTRIYVNLAHGSNGTATAPLGAAIVAELMSCDFASVTRAEMAAISPDRFAPRQRRRGLRHGARPG